MENQTSCFFSLIKKLSLYTSCFKTILSFVFIPKISKKTIITLIIFAPLLVQSQTHQYLFNNNLNEQSGGPALTQLLSCGAAAGSYGVQTSGTTAGDCLTSNAFCFNDGGGLQYPNSGLISGSYTINMFLRFSTLGGYARVIDFSNSASDAGIYFLGFCLNLYPNGNVGTCPYFNTNTYYLITFVRDGGTNIISVYVDGTLFGTYNDASNLYRPATGTEPINFFRDDNAVACENQPGCIKFISVGPGVATASDVALLWANIDLATQSTLATPPTVTISAPGNFTCATSAVTLSASSAGTMVWNGGSLSNSSNPAMVSATGTYTVTATDANGCTDTAMVTVATNTTPPVVTALSSGDLSCSVASVTLTGTSSGNTMVWNGGTLTNAANPATVTAAGTYTVTATDAINGCTNTASVTVVVDNSLPLAIAVNSPTICTGQTATLTATGGTTYSWSTGATTNPITVTPASTASYTVTGTSGGCSGTAIATVTVGSSLTITVNSPTICAGQSATLTAVGGTTYLWSTGSTANPLIVSPSSITSYTVTGTSGSCSGTAIATVTPAGSLTVTVNSPTICAGQTTTLTAAGGTTYVWSTGATTNPITVSPTIITSYTVIGTTSGCSATAIATVTISPSPGITVNSATICVGQTATLTAVGGASYSWNSGATTNPISVTPSATTSYTVTGTASGCSGNAVSTVTVNQSPAVIVNSPGICVGGLATLTASGASTYLWSTGATTAQITDSPVSTTTYTVTGTTAGCSNTAIATVTVNPFLSVTANNAASICAGASATITALAVDGSNGSYTYSWTPGGGTGSSLSVSPSATTTYTVTANDGCSPPAIDSVTIIVLPAAIVAFNADIVSGCAPLCVNFTNISTVTGGSIAAQNWDFGGDLPNVQHCFTVPGQYSVTLNVTTNSGCISTYTNTNMIQVASFPGASFTAPLSTGILAPTVDFTDNSTGATSWTWDFGDSLSSSSGNLSNLQNPAHTYSEIGTYCVKLIVGNTNGCYDTTQLCIAIDPEFSFYIPNSFSPDGNGINDEFYCKSENFKEFKMQIFDRWGNMIFYTEDIDKHWNGKAAGGADLVLFDTYVYIVDIVDNKKKHHQYIGSATIVK
ncbi:MAG: PKD domain-containing protein [Bacteroidota bacterium]